MPKQKDYQLTQSPSLSHLLIGHLEELERGLLQLGDGALDLLGVHLVLVGQLVPHFRDLLPHLGDLLRVDLVLVLLHLGLGVVQDALGLLKNERK